MRVRTRLLAVAALAATFAVPAPAAFAAPSPSGVLCGVASVADPQVEGSQTGEVDAGPLFWTDDTDPTVTYSGSITCTIQVNASTHAGANACEVTGPETPAVGFAAGTCTYATTADDNVYLCTSVVVDGTTLYYSDSNDPLVDGSWTTSSSASCGMATSASSGGGRKTPYYPTGVIEISTLGTGIVNYTYSAFNPPVALWTCAQAPDNTDAWARCTPPPPPPRARNVCGVVTVGVSAASGSAGGVSACAGGPYASAVSHAPTPAADVAQPEDAFSWTCDGPAPGIGQIWTIRCYVGQGTQEPSAEDEPVVAVPPVIA